MSEKQLTLGNEIFITGTGIHTGEPVSVRLKPAPENTGVVFVRTDLPHNPTIPASYQYVHHAEQGLRRTTLVKGDAEVQTVEHLMAALWGSGLDNVYVEVSGIELPALDGSARPYVEKIFEAGLKEQEAARRYFTLREPVVVQEGDASITALPSTRAKFSYCLSYQHPLLQAQQASFEENGTQSFIDEVAPARTFCLKEEAEALRKAGFGKGADYENTLVLDSQGVIHNTLRFENECARHKLLDLIGDLFLLGVRIKAHVFAIKSGHPLNAKLLTKLNQAFQQWQTGALQSASEKVVGPQLDILAIQKILPHRYPFLLVDRVIELTDQSAVGIKNVTMNEGFFQGHFPGHPVMPGVLMIEALAQLSGIIMLNKPEHRGKIAYFMAVDKVKFRKPVTPGDQLELRVEVNKIRSRTGTVTGKALVDGKVVCEGELMFALAEA